MIRADLVVRNLSEAATLAGGPVPRTGPALREIGLVDAAAIAIDSGRFVWVGPERALRGAVRLRRGGRTVDAHGGSAVPGLVDAHTHVLFAGERARELELKASGAGYLEIARQGGGLLATVRATRAASTEELLRASVERLRAMARTGTTSAEVKSGYALEHAGELRLLRLIPRLARATGLRLVATYLGAHAVPPELNGRSAPYVREIVGRTLPAVAADGLARFCDVFCEPGFFSPRESERILRAAARLGLRLKVHADEFELTGGARLAARRGATSADHLLATPVSDLARLGRSGVVAVLLPWTAYASGRTRRSPCREAVDAGVAVALGTDCSPATWATSMPNVLAAAVHGGRLTPAEALAAATVNSAAASGLSDAGTIEVGRPADLAIFPFPRVDQLGYRFDALPTLVLRQGKSVFSS